MELKLKKLELKNIKGVKHFQAIMDGQNTYLVGSNGEGKTSSLQAVMLAMSSRYSKKNYIPAPIRAGIDGSEELGEILIDFTDENGLTYKFTREYIPTKKGFRIKDTFINPQLEIINGDERFAKIGEASWMDISSFLKLQGTKEGRKKAVKFFVSEINPDLDIDQYEKHVKELKGEIKAYKQQTNTIMGSFNDFSYTTVRDYNSQKPDLDQALLLRDRKIKTINQVEKYKNILDNREDYLAPKQKAVADAEEALKKAKQELKDGREYLQECLSFLEENPIQDSKEEVEQVYQEAVQKELLHNQIMQKKPDIKRLENISTALREKEEALKKHEEDFWLQLDLAVTMLPHNIVIDTEGDSPVFKYLKDDGTLLPLESNQIQTSHLMQALLELNFNVMRSSPYRVLVLQEGIALDEETTHTLLERVKAEGFQILIEKVAWKKQPLLAVSCEDYDHEELPIKPDSETRTG